MWTGSFTILPQVFFMNNYPAEKMKLLSITLIFGILTSIAGISLSGKSTYRFKRFSFMSLFVITVASFLGLFFIEHSLLYILSFITFRFVSEFIYNTLDHHFLATIEKKQMSTYVNSNLIFQLLGSLSAPFYFAFCYEYSISHILILTLGMVVPLSLILTSSTSFGGNISQKEHSTKAIIKEHLSFISYTIILYSVLAVVSSSLIYILKDYYHYSNASEVGGVVVGIATFCSIAFILFFSFIHKKSPKLWGKETFLILISMAISIGGFALKARSSFAYIILASLPLGLGYGGFLLWGRHIVSKTVLESGKKGLLSLYNNLVNYGSLTGFIMIYGATILLPKRYFFTLQFSILFTALATAGIIALWQKQKASTRTE